MNQIVVEHQQIKPEMKDSERGLIAIVDDYASVRASTLRLPRWSGLRAEGFYCAAEFLRSEFLAHTACLLLDVRMPGMGGLELQRRLAESGRQIPILFSSARASEEEERRALQAGAAGFLRKPVRKEALIGAIQAILETPATNKD